MTRGYTSAYYGVSLRGGQGGWLYNPARFTARVKQLTDQFDVKQDVFVTDEETGKRYVVKLELPVFVGPRYVIILDEGEKGFYVLHGYDSVSPPSALSREQASKEFDVPATTWAELELDHSKWTSPDVKTLFFRKSAQVAVVILASSTHQIKRYGNIQLNGAPQVVQQLTDKLSGACPGWYLQLDWMYELPGHVAGFYDANVLTLCLYYENKCVSSVQLEESLDSHVLDLASFTVPSMEGRKFNRFLRACAILVARELTVNGTAVKVLHSTAVNKVSAYLIMSHYNVVLDPDFERYLNSLAAQGGDEQVTLQLLDDYIEVTDKPLMFDIDLDANVENAVEEVDALTLGASKLRCRDAFATGEPVAKRARR